MKDKFIWNQGKTGCVNINKVRNFTIEETGIEISKRHSVGFKVVAWFNDKETLWVGEFGTMEEAQAFLGRGLK